MKLHISKEELYDLYINQKLSAKQIGLLKGYKSEMPVLRLIKEYNIIKPLSDRLEQAKIVRKKTNIEKYGCEYVAKTEESKRKTKEYFIKKYGVENPSYCQDNKKKISIKNKENAKIRMAKTRETCLKRYGVDNYTKTNECKEKRKKTCLKRYGVETPLLRKDVLELSHSDIIIDKQCSTKRKNKTFNSSSIETKIYNLLCNKYIIVKQQYKSNAYPFMCDFYIPSKDLYIEYQGFWTHGKEPYIGTPEQKEKVKLWESKNTRQYIKAINDWTVRDPLKRKIAKNNNLNYLEFFNINQFMEWYNNNK